jgi:hypothetical protein
MSKSVLVLAEEPSEPVRKEYYEGFGDGIDGRPCSTVSIDYLRGYKEGKALADKRARRVR